MVAPPVHLFVGSDEMRKREKLEQIERELFPPELRDLNTTFLYGDDRRISQKDLTELFCLLPTEGARAHLLVVRMAHKLKSALRAALIADMSAASRRTAVVVDIPESKGEEEFVRALTAVGAMIVRFKEKEARSVFDLGRAIVERRPEEALGILGELLRSRERSEKLLGGLVWQWEKFFSQKRIGPQGYGQGLKLMLDADRKLKSNVSAAAREHAILETLVVRLSFLERG
jgi:DNA polymerase III delta subunit